MSSLKRYVVHLQIESAKRPLIYKLVDMVIAVKYHVY